MTKTDTTPKRAVIYVRLSSHRGESDPSTSPARQREVCDAYCRMNGWDVVDVIEDLNVSGSAKGLRLDRPGLKRVREHMDSGSVDVLIFAKIDRIARSVSDFWSIVSEAEKHNVAVVSVAESLDLTTPMGRFVANVLSAFAEMEAETIAARLTEGIAAVVEQGRWRGGMAPYGYKIVPHESGRGVGLAVAPDEAAVVRRAVASLLGGATMYQTVTALNQDGVAARKGGEWTMPAMRRIVTSDASVGRMMRKGEVLRDEDGLPRQLWDPIISASELARLRVILPPMATGQATGRLKAARLLSGLAVCGSCGTRLVAGSKRGGKLIYRCPTRSAGRGSCATAVSIDAESLDKHVVDTLMELCGDVPVWSMVEVIDDHEDERVEIELALRETTAAMQEPDADIPSLVTRVQALHARRAGLEAAPVVVTHEPDPVERGTFRGEWDSAETLEAKRAILTSAIDRVVVMPGVPRVRVPVADRVRIEWSADEARDRSLPNQGG